jgi:preprotein translocase subunit SecY
MKINSKNTKSRSLQSRIFLTLGLLSIVRLGSFIPVPYLDRESFFSVLEKENSSINAFAQVLNSFSGSKANSFGLLSLGILPYINASIVVQLLTTAIPSLAKMQKEDGEYGRRKITEYVRYFTFFWAIVESLSLTYSFKALIFDWGFWTAAHISLCLISGSMIVLWFSELITKNGLGNGSSLLICFNIVSSLPEQIKAFVFSLQGQSNALESSLFLGLVFLVTTVGCIYINEATIRIPLVSARQLLRKVETKPKEVGNTSLPLKINQAGVMPLVFTSYAMVLLSSLMGILKNQLSNPFYFLNEGILFWGGKLIFWGIYASLIFFFTYFYSTIVLDPKDVAERLRKNSVVILGIAPGNATKTYLSKTLRRIASINALFLISNIIGIQVIESFLTLNLVSLRGLGFTSQLILVNVLIDTLKRIRSFLNEEELTT